MHLYDSRLICVYIYIYTHIHTCTHVYMYMYVYVYIYMHIVSQLTVIDNGCTPAFHAAIEDLGGFRSRLDLICKE